MYWWWILRYKTLCHGSTSNSIWKMYNIHKQQYTNFHNIHIVNRVLKRLEYGWKWQTSISCRIITNTKGPCTSSPKLSYAVFYFHFFIFIVLSYQNACNGCENAENRTWSEFLYDGRMFRRQCVNMIDTTWGRIYFFNVNVKTNVYILVLAKSCLTYLILVDCPVSYAHITEMKWLTNGHSCWL